MTFDELHAATVRAAKKLGMIVEGDFAGTPAPISLSKLAEEILDQHDKAMKREKQR